MTAAETTTPRVRAIMAEVFNVPASEIHSDTSPETLEAWNSFSHTVLVGALEEAFGIEFDIDDLLELRSLDRIVATMSDRYQVR